MNFLPDNPDRSAHYKDASPSKLLDQLNENFRQLRLLHTAVSDRDRVVAELHESIKQRDDSIKRRDEIIAQQTKKIHLFNKFRPFIYAAIGGAVTALAEWGMTAILHLKK